MGPVGNLSKIWPAALIFVELIIHSLCTCSTVESWPAPWSPKLSKNVDLERFLAPNKTNVRRNMPSAGAAVEASRSMVPALFVFGDSTVDVGNNNNLQTLAQATFWPYGKDFDTHLPTGRFCDGRLSVDYIANFLRLPLVPSFASNTSFKQGVNFASAGSGVLQDTGSIFGQYISFPEQLNNLWTVKEKLEAELGASKASKIISKSIYYISTGSNDLINNYLLPNSLYWQLDLADFQQLVLVTFTQQIKTLFKMGARKIVVVSLSPLGCLPSQLFKMGSKQGECIVKVNEMAMNYNKLLADRLHSLRRHLPGVKLVYNDAYLAVSNITHRATSYGITHTNQSCCGAGPYGGMKSCLAWSTVCQNASDHLWWDEFHPTGIAYKLIADSFWSGSVEVSSPWNVKTLASL